MPRSPRSLDELSDAPLGDDDDAIAKAEDLSARLADLLSDRRAGASTIRFLEDLDKSLSERGYLTKGQVDALEVIEARADTDRRSF